MKSFTLSASRPDNIAVVKRGKNVRLEIEKERLREKPRKATKEIEATGDLVTNHVNVVRPGESVIHQNSQKHETLNLFHIHTIFAECTSMHLVFKEFSFRPFLSSYKFAKSRLS